MLKMLKAAGLRKILVKKLTYYYKMQASWGSGREYYFLNKQKGKKYFFQFLLPLGLFHVGHVCHNNGSQPIRRPDNLLKEAI